MTATQSIGSTEKAFKREGNGYTDTLERQVVEKERISPSGKSNLEQVVKGEGRNILAIQGHDVQSRSRSYRNQHNFIIYTSEVENVIV